MAQQRPPAGPMASAFNFPSPGETPTHHQAFKDAVVHAKAMMQAYDAAVLRQAVRELWEMTLVGSEYHNSFLCSTMFHRASPGTLGRTIEQHGVRLVQHSAGQIAKHLRQEDLDMIAPILLPKFSMAFLDKALALRLESIQAQQLVNALGRAERLGYDVRDVVTGTAPVSGAARQEKVIPTANPIPVPPASLMPGRPGAQRAPQPPQNRGPSSPSAGLPSDQDIMRLGIAFCEKCNRPCGGFKALLAHQRSGLCGSLPVPVENLGKDYCLFCGQRFIGGGGLTYHTKNNVCGRYTEENADALMKLFYDAHKVLRRRAEGGGPPSKGRPPAAAARQSVAQESPSQGSKDPYAVLSPNSRLAFDAAMAIVEHRFAEELKKASTFPAHAQKAEIARVKNLYNNKQSMTRKKFGIRLRERRSRSEIDEERARMLSSRPGTPASTGKRAFSEVDGTPVATGERDSASTQGTPKRVLLTETANGAAVAAAGGSPTTADRADSASTATSPVVSRPAALVKAGATPRPVPMSIAGSYTAPIQVANAAMSNTPTDGKTPIEIDDDEEEDEEEEEEEEGEEDGETADEDANGNQSDMEVDE